MGTIFSKLAELTQKIEALEEKLKNVPKDFAPPIGTYLYSKIDPSLTYTGTTWTKIAGGTYLTAADETSYITSVLYGTNSLQLTANNIPSHSHTMTHTHTGPSHTHGVGTLATNSAGKHSHVLPRKTINYATTSPSTWAFTTVETTTAKQENTTSVDSHTHTISGSTAAAGNGNTGASSATNTGSTGKGTAFNNMPKSIAIPLWTRTS